MPHKTDAQRAAELGMTLDRFQELVGADPLDLHPEYVDAGVVVPHDRETEFDEEENPKLKKRKKAKQALEDAEVEFFEYTEKSEAGGPYSLHDALTDVTGIGDGTMVPFQTDQDVEQKRSFELEHYWDKAPSTPEEWALYYGFHVHSKDNMYGLHAHYPGGPLGGGHMHGAQNRWGYHTHRYDLDQLTQFKFQRPGLMIDLDGPHSHEANAPDGKHTHKSGNFGPDPEGLRKDGELK